MLCLSPNNKKWSSDYNKRLNNCYKSDFQIISYDISENHKIFNELWTMELKLLIVSDNVESSIKIPSLYNKRTLFEDINICSEEN